MKLSKYFDTNSDTMILNENKPTDDQLKSLTQICQIADLIRDFAGVTIVSSGLRSDAKQQELIKAGLGATASKHLSGEALDLTFKTTNINQVFDWCRKNVIKLLDKIILEADSSGNRWIHIQINKEGLRHQSFVSHWNPKTQQMEYEFLG